jgi:hypothetical protein
MKGGARTGHISPTDAAQRASREKVFHDGPDIGSWLNMTDQSLDAGRGAAEEEGTRLAVLQVIRIRKPQCQHVRCVIALIAAPRAVAP